jgi:glycosyltransferase involved in cell wall biosynthesis
MSKKICIVSQSHLCRNPRVLKESIALSQAGYYVNILTAIYSDKLLREDLELLKNTAIKYEFYSNLSVPGFGSFKSRLIKKLAVILQIKFNIESKFSLGYSIRLLKKKCIAHLADLYIMHQELATVIGSEMIDKYNVAFDLEDWYSEDLLPSARKTRPIQLLKKAEKIALERGVCCYTTSNAMAAGLKAAYKNNKLPAVIYNSFDNTGLSKQADRKAGPIKLYWFSQTIGAGRGLEFFINCMAKSSFGWELNLRGNIDQNYHDYLKSIMSSKDSLIILPMLKNDEILNDMTNYDLGLALEPAFPPNKNLTISNKFFHYMAGGLPVIASDTKGHAEIWLKNPEIVFLYKQNDQVGLTDLLNIIGNKINNGSFQNLNEVVIKTYKTNFSWNIEEKKLVNLISSSFISPFYKNQ